MAYEIENITYSQKIFYYLLCHGALNDTDMGVDDLYRCICGTGRGYESC